MHDGYIMMMIMMFYVCLIDSMFMMMDALMYDYSYMDYATSDALC